MGGIWTWIRGAMLRYTGGLLGALGASLISLLIGQPCVLMEALQSSVEGCAFSCPVLPLVICPLPLTHSCQTVECIASVCIFMHLLVSLFVKLNLYIIRSPDPSSHPGFVGGSPQNTHSSLSPNPSPPICTWKTHC